MVSLNGNELDTYFDAQQKLMPQSQIKDAVEVKRDTKMQAAIKKLLRKKMRALDQTEQKEEVVEKLVEIK